MAKQSGDVRSHGVLRSLGLGLITGAADDDCSAIGTYAQAGAQLGYGVLWAAPVVFPMMVTVVYLSGKLGQVTGQGLFTVLRQHLPRWALYAFLILTLTGNLIEAGADMSGMAAAAGLLLHVPRWLLIAGITAAALAFQLLGSYGVIKNVFRILALSLLAYVASAFLAHPHWPSVARGTFLGAGMQWNRDSLEMLVAIVGTALSTYIFTWQSNEEVEEKSEDGPRRGTTDAALRTSAWDVVFGMIFSSGVMYFILLSTAATLFPAGKHVLNTAAEAAQALQPVAGRAAGLLFTLGIVGVGFLAIPVMTIGAAYNLSQTRGWRNGLRYRPRQAPRFYGAIAGFTLLAAGLGLLPINPIRALVLAGVVQGFSTPPLLLLITLLTSRRAVMGDKRNGPLTQAAAWATTGVTFAAAAALAVSYLHR